ncbi:MAG: hypothetical protein ACREQL_02485, partial [Candidatus Binatia bacterium]
MRALGAGWLGLTLGVAGAQEAPPTALPAAPTASTTLPEAIAASDISTRAERTNAELREWETRLADAPEVVTIAKGLPRLRNELLRLAAHSLEDTSEVSPREIDDLRREWQLTQEQLASWTETIAKRTQGLETGLARLRELDDTWARTAEAAARDGLPEAVTREIAAVRTSVRAVQARARAQRDSLLTLASQIGTLQGSVSEGLQSVTEEAARMDTDLLVTDSAPLWRALREGARAEPLADTIARTWRRNLEHIRIAVGLDRARIGRELLAFLVLLSMMLAVRNRSRTWPPDDPALPHVLVIAKRPVSATLIVALLLHWLFSGMFPMAVGEAASLLVLVPVLCLLYDRLHAKLRTLVVAGAALFMLVSVRRVLPVASTEARLLLAVENLLAALWTLWAVRPHQLARLALSPAQRRWLLYGARVAIALFGVALTSNLVGNVALALVITRAVLGSTFLGLLVYETCRVVEGFVVAALHAPDRILLKAVANHAPALRRRLSTVVRGLAAAGWVVGTLNIVGALSPVMGVVEGMLSARLEIGALSLSASDVLAFVLTVWLSAVIARVVRVVLQDDVLPRMDLPRGVPSAV